ncbi:MAG: hypothetical protein ACYCV7_09655 [Acidimicrobiales bacterium]
MSEQTMPVGDDIAEVSVVPPPASPASSAVPRPKVSLVPIDAVTGGVPAGSEWVGVAGAGAAGRRDGVRTVGRRLRRKERRDRRRVVVICGLVVAACLAVTVFILGMARDRPARAGVVGSSGVVVPRAAVSFLEPVGQNSPITGAPAPEGGPS